MRCDVGLCLENYYGPMFIFSKFPEKSPPMWNLISLLPPLIWGCTFASLCIIVVFFMISAKLYANMGLKKNIKTEEITLVPFR